MLLSSPSQERERKAAVKRESLLWTRSERADTNAAEDAAFRSRFNTVDRPTAESAWAATASGSQRVAACNDNDSAREVSKVISASTLEPRQGARHYYHTPDVVDFFQILCMYRQHPARSWG
jgi:hypothetical protein